MTEQAANASFSNEALTSLTGISLSLSLSLFLSLSLSLSLARALSLSAHFSVCVQSNDIFHQSELK